jgi:hypothetical protein
MQWACQGPSDLQGMLPHLRYLPCCNHLLRCSTCRNRKPDYYIHCHLHLTSCLCHIFQKTIAEYQK